jgi:hypothetical protein
VLSANGSRARSRVPSGCFFGTENVPKDGTSREGTVGVLRQQSTAWGGGWGHYDSTRKGAMTNAQLIGGAILRSAEQKADSAAPGRRHMLHLHTRKINDATTSL